MDDLVKLMNRGSSEKITPEQVIEALHGLKAKGVIDFRIFPNGLIEIDMIAPELMYGRPTYH